MWIAVKRIKILHSLFQAVFFIILNRTVALVRKWQEQWGLKRFMRTGPPERNLRGEGILQSVKAY